MDRTQLLTLHQKITVTSSPPSRPEIGAVAGLLPALRAARTLPTEALRSL